MYACLCSFWRNVEGTGASAPALPSSPVTKVKSATELDTLRNSNSP